ncbi:rCG36128 [Rattus norvegicus]|uniref:RCG36128 n=1 Tax=Rattus norvegicus TaxID=10116 RepID=A6IJT4_RAT|nr:rCG36128 [Rattus norvegicus]
MWRSLCSGHQSVNKSLQG